MIDLDERTALLRTIHEHPDDDVPRLVYADWLSVFRDPFTGAPINFTPG